MGGVCPVDRRPNLVAGIAMACLFATGCGSPTATERAPVVTAERGAVTPSPTVDPTAVADAATFGPWRRRPVIASPAVTAAAEAACRALPAIGAVPLVVLDARGEGLLTLVFADGDSAAVCHAVAAAGGDATADARVLPNLAGTPAPVEGKLGAFDVEEIATASGARQVVVGRVADVPEVGVSFDDATWGKASIGAGWYVAWWPKAALALTVASVDNRSVVIDSFAVP
jgi:hypothetical protein